MGRIDPLVACMGWVGLGRLVKFYFCGIQKMVRTQFGCLTAVPKTVFVTQTLANSTT